MAISQQQKVDYLLKKIGFSKAKTGAPDSSGMSGTQTEKQPFGEAIPSPLVVPNSSLWNEGDSIPATPPGSDTSQVKVYLKSSPVRMTADSSIANNRAFIAYTTYNNTSSARLTNWIDTQFGPDYQIEVYREDPSSGTEGVDYFKLAEGGGNTTTGSPDGWFFDYSAGVLNFSDTNTPASISSSNIYIVGYRYIGQTGAPTSGISTFSYLDLAVERNLDIGAQGGISTFRNVIEATAGENKIPSLYATQGALPSAGSYHGMFAHVHQTGRGYFAHAGNWLELVNRETNGIVGTGTENYQIGIITATNATFTGDVSIAGTLTYQDVTSIDSVGIITANQGVDVPGGEVKVGNNIQLGNAGVITAISFVGDGSGLIGVASTDNIVTGTAATFNNTVDINGDLDVDGHTNLDNVSVSGITTFSGIIDAVNTPASIRVAQDIQHKGDADTKISFPSADTITFDTAGTEKLRINSTGISIPVDLDITGDLDVDGHTNLDNVSIAGFTTITQDLDVDGHTNLDNVSVSGVSTFSDTILLTGSNEIFFENANAQIKRQSGDWLFNLSGNYDLKFTTNASGGTGGNIYLQPKFGENGVVVNSDSSVELYYDNSKKLETIGTGVTVTGDLYATAFFGDGSGLIGVASTDYIITGTAATFNNSVDFNGQVNFNSTLNFGGAGTGLNGQYLRSTGSGVAWASFPTMRTTTTVTASAGQTTFSFTYNVGFLDVFINGTKLTDSEFTATNGSSVVLAVGCFVGDIVELVSYNTVAGGGSGGGINIQDEGSQLSTTATTLNFVGDGIVASGNGAVKTITVGAASTSELRANTLEVVGVSTFSANVNIVDNVALNFADGVRGSIKSDGDGLAIKSVGSNDIIIKANSSGGTAGDIVLQSGNTTIVQAHGTGDVDITNTLGIGGSITKASGNLDIRASNLNLKNAAGSSTYAVFNNGGSAELNWNNTKRLETSNSGVTVTGTLSATAFDGDGSALTGLPGATSDAQFNTKSGTNAGSSFNGVNPIHNTLFGYKAGESIDNGDRNTFVGSEAGKNATDSSNAVAVGYQALYSMGASRSYQTAVGYQALYSNAHGQECTAVGYQALHSNNSGDDQCAFGVFSLKNSNGADNTAFGYKSLMDVSGGSQNAAFGSLALENNSSGDYNSAIGYKAGDTLVSGDNNTFLGQNSQPSTTSVSNEITLGNANVNHLRIPGIGVSFGKGGAVVSGIVTASQFIGDGSQLTGIPGGSGVTVDTTGNTSAGTNAGASITWPSAQKNTLYGFDAGKLISASDEQSAFGHSALESHNNSSNGGNSAFGYQALQTSTSIYNAAFGRNALQSENGNGYNAAFGASAGESVSTGHDNTLIGYAAGDNLQTGTYNIVIGSNADTSYSSVNRECTIGGQTSGTTIQTLRVPGIGFTVTNTSNSIPSNHSQLSLTGHANFVGVVTASNVSVASSVTANKFYGDGSNLTNLPGGGGGGGSGISTISNFVNIADSLDVDGHTNLDNVSIAGVTTFSNTVNASTINATTFAGNGDFVDLDVDGHTNLDNVSVSGITTFSEALFLPDNKELRIGNTASNPDLKIYHSPQNSFIANQFGNLYITDSDGDIYIQAKAGENSIICHNDGAVQLYHDDNMKFSTTSVGVSINQDLDVDGHTNLDNVSISGVVTATTFNGSLAASNLTGALPSISGANLTSLTAGNLTGTLPAISGANLTNLPSPDPSDTDVQVTFDIAGNSGSGYTFTGPGNDGTTGNPDIYLIRGQRYRFNNTTGSGHPFEFRNAANNADYTDGITGSQSGIQDFNVQYDAPAQLKYRCTIHTSSMVGNIYIVGSFPKISVSGQSDVVADNLADTLTLAAGNNVSITTNASTDTITISATDTTTNYYANSLSFNTSNGVLTVGRAGLTDLTVDLDGRYLDSSSSLSATNLTGTINNSRLPTSIDLGSSGEIKAKNFQTSGQSNSLTSAGFHAYQSAGGFQGVSIVKDVGGTGNWGTALFVHRLSTSGTGNLIEFQYNGTGVGNINTNGSTVTYNPPSDYRLKQDVSNITDAITKIKSLRPVNYRWKNNVDIGYDTGFIAHEVQETGYFNHSVTGVKDGTRTKYDDPSTTEPDYQGLDYTKFTPMLVAALKEISDKVDALDTRLTSLENT